MYLDLVRPKAFFVYMRIVLLDDVDFLSRLVLEVLLSHDSGDACTHDHSGREHDSRFKNTIHNPVLSEEGTRIAMGSQRRLVGISHIL